MYYNIFNIWIIKQNNAPKRHQEQRHYLSQIMVVVEELVPERQAIKDNEVRRNKKVLRRPFTYL